VADGITLTLQPRIDLGKKVRRLRRGGIIPVHLYGPGITSQPLQCEGRELIRVLTRAGGNTPISITIEGEVDEHLAFVREIQWNPIRGDLFHVDFLRAELTQRVAAEVPVVMVGDSPGARQAMGTVVQQLRTVNVVALPLEMPSQLTLDLSTLTEPDGVLRAGDASLPEGATLLTAPDTVVARIQVARAEAFEGEAEALEAEAPSEPEAD
jgi:large subunit ribosomal protein L25